jgi:hypothetical protein
MLDNTRCSPSVNHQNGQISGRGLAHRKMGYPERLELAADVAEGVRRYEQTHAEIADSFEVSQSSLCRELKERARWRIEHDLKLDRDDYAIACIIEGINIASPSALDKAFREDGIFAKVWKAIDHLTCSR